jgi:hypothetical protein
MMLVELAALLERVPLGSVPAVYREAILQRNVLGKSTDSTKQKSLRHLRELYALDEQVLLFGSLRRLYALDPTSLPLLALQVAWSRDPLLRATTPPVASAAEGARVATELLARTVTDAFPGQYSGLNANKVARNAASSWTQSGHLSGRATKTRQRVKPTPVAATMALLLGKAAGHHGPSVFTSAWCRLLDLSSSGARTLGFEAHRAGLLDLHAMGEVVEISFPRFPEFEEPRP